MADENKAAGEDPIRPVADMQCGHSHQECEQVRAENERLRKPDLRMMYGYELGIEDGKAERDALAAKADGLEGLLLYLIDAGALDEQTTAYVRANLKAAAVLDTPEGEKTDV